MEADSVHLSETCSLEQLGRYKRHASNDDLGGKVSFDEGVKEVFFLSKLAIVLFRLFRHGWKWFEKTFMLFWFITVLSPAFWYGVWLWVRNVRCLRNIKYGTNGRNYMDLYIPRKTSGPGKAPVVVFVTGGAWMIGYKLWVTYITPLWNNAGVILVAPDYRNFPQGVIGDMCQDVSSCLDWVFENIEHYGGDVENVSLAGQSAGAHIVTLLATDRAEQEWVHAHYGPRHRSRSFEEVLGTTTSPSSTSSWSIKQIRRVIAISGPYDLSGKVGDQLHGRGLYKSVLSAIMDGDLTEHSPTPRIRRIAKQKIMMDEPAKSGDDPAMRKRALHQGNAFAMPSVVLLHGMKDQTVHYTNALEFGKALEKAGVRVEIKLYGEGTHTTPLIEDVFSHNNQMIRDAIAYVYESPDGDDRAPSVLNSTALYEGCVWYPYPLVYLAKWLNPF